MDIAVQAYITKSTAPSTLQSYKSAVNSYLEFCCKFCLMSPLPLSESVLGSFVAYLASKNTLYNNTLIVCVCVFVSVSVCVSVQPEISGTGGRITTPLTPS